MILAHTLSPEVRAALATPQALHASPTFVLCGRRTRGRFAGRRLARIRRSDARRETPDTGAPEVGASLQAFAELWSSSARR